MLKYFGPLSFTDIIFGVFIAFLITTLIIKIRRFCKVLKMHHKEAISVKYKGVDLSAITAKCRSMFPIETIQFHGNEFKRGMKIKIITMQKKVIEGELVGKNKMGILCILTREHIVAHEIDKIQDITCVDSKTA